jgi:hypothetical protein
MEMEYAQQDESAGDRNYTPSDPNEQYTPGPEPPAPYRPQPGEDFTPYDPTDPQQNQSPPPMQYDMDHPPPATIGPDPHTHPSNPRFPLPPAEERDPVDEWEDELRHTLPEEVRPELPEVVAD